MKETKRYKHYINRNCPLCNSTKGEYLSSISGKQQGRQFDHNIEMHVCICQKCGFVYANPVIPQKEMNGYYQDMLTLYESESSYSVDKRIELIKKYAQDEQVIIEIGGNEQGTFRCELENIFDRYISVDTNNSAENTESSIKNVKDVGDILAAYFVLEHIVDIEEFLEDCYESLKEGGIFIIEVPDVTQYYSEINGLNHIEHVNHFTPESLTKLMNKMGFELLEISRKYVSRSFGFAGIYRKQGEKIESFLYDKNAYMISKSYLMEGFHKIEQSKNKFNKLVAELKNMMIYAGGGMAFWCGNEVMRRIAELGGCDLIKNALIIDEDIRKKELYQEFTTETSEEAWKSGKLKKIRYLVICSESRVESIVTTLKDKYKEVYVHMNIYFIDNNWNLNGYKSE